MSGEILVASGPELNKLVDALEKSSEKPWPFVEKEDTLGQTRIEVTGRNDMRIQLYMHEDHPTFPWHEVGRVSLVKKGGEFQVKSMLTYVRDENDQSYLVIWDKRFGVTWQNREKESVTISGLKRERKWEELPQVNLSDRCDLEVNVQSFADEMIRNAARGVFSIPKLKFAESGSE
ncbi:hypothetical protein ACFL2V_09815 [Pseudomonadota bacterium]